MNVSLKTAAVCTAALFASLFAGAGQPAAQNVDFAGKTVEMTVGFAAGGGVDLYSRSLGRHLAKHLPGSPNLVVRNQPGAGGVVALNEWTQRAGKDGLNVTMGALSQTDPDALRKTKARFKPSDFKMIGGLGAYSQGLFIRTDAIPRLTDKSKPPVVVGIVGSTLRGGTYMILFGGAFLDWNVKWVAGYHSTGDMRQALERGEIDMSTFGAPRDFDYLQKAGGISVIAQTGQVEDGKRVKRPLLDAPIFSDLVKGKIKDPRGEKAFSYWQQVNQVGMWLALPPGTPDAVVNTYVKAFEATNKDPEFNKEYSKVAPDPIVAHKKDLEEQLMELADVTADTVSWISEQEKRQGIGGQK